MLNLSLVVLLSRLLNPSTGRVCIDGLDTKDLGLLTLRQAMAIIPQTPLLLGASVRKNLDPFDEHPTEALQDALRAVGLSTGLLDDTKANAGERVRLRIRVGLGSGKGVSRDVVRRRAFFLCV